MPHLIRISYIYFSFRVVIAKPIRRDLVPFFSGMWPAAKQQKVCKEYCTYYKESIMIHLLYIHQTGKTMSKSKLCWHYGINNGNN